MTGFHGVEPGPFEYLVAIQADVFLFGACVDACQAPHAEGELPVGLGGVNCSVAARTVESAGGVNQPRESPFGLFIRIGWEGSGAVVVIMEGHVAALRLHQRQTTENRDAGDCQNPPAHHSFPFNLRISYALNEPPVAVPQRSGVDMRLNCSCPLVGFYQGRVEDTPYA